MNLTGSPGRRAGFRVFSAGSLGALALMSISAAPSAWAGDWSLQSRISEKADFNDNYGLNVDSSGNVYGSVTDVYGDLIYLTHDSRFDLIGDIVARKYWGPGDEDILDGFLPRIESKYHEDAKRMSFDVDAYYAQQEVSAANALDVASGTSPSTKRNFGGSFGIGRKLGPRDSLYWANTVARTAYDGEGIDNRSLDSSLSWTHRLTKLVDRKLTIGANALNYDAPDNPDKKVYRGRVDFTATLSPRLLAYVGGGVNLTKTDVANSKLEYGLLADAGFTYNLKTTTISGSANYGQSQGTFGELQTQASLGLSVSEKINDRSTLSVGVAAQMVKGDSGGTGSTASGDTFGVSISPAYKYLLTDEWDLQAGYNWRLKDSDEGTAQSNEVFLQLTRNFTAIP